jgi:hypothetical protein
MERRDLFRKALGAVAGTASALLVGRYVDPPVSVARLEATALAPATLGFSSPPLEPGSVEWYFADGTLKGTTVVPIINYKEDSDRYFILAGHVPAMLLGHWSKTRVLDVGLAWTYLHGERGDLTLGVPATGPLAPGTLFMWAEGPAAGRWGVVTKPYLQLPSIQRHLADGNFEAMLATEEGRVLLVHRSQLG